MKGLPKNIVIAAGGTGGHLFPAQALARDFQKENPSYSILFMGKGLSSSPFFHRELFEYKEVCSSSLSLKHIFRSVGTLLKGIWRAFFLLKESKPTLIVGFGSFHVFPVLAAGLLRGIPIVLFESNSVPGKVNRLFSFFAIFSGLQFFSAQKHMKGKCLEVQIPLWRVFSKKTTKQEAASYFSLSSDVFTFLVFGGSQGAKSLNGILLDVFASLKSRGVVFQVIHCIGSAASLEEIQNHYAQCQIPVCVKSFEERMDLAWVLADAAICRSGAATLSELLLFEVPSLLIPYPYASENHQLKNSLFFRDEVGGAFILEEKDICFDKMQLFLEFLRDTSKNNSMKESIKEFKAKQKATSLSHLIRKSIDIVV